MIVIDLITSRLVDGFNISLQQRKMGVKHVAIQLYHANVEILNHCVKSKYVIAIWELFGEFS